MSDLSQLASRISRKIAGATFAIQVEVVDAGGVTTVSNPLTSLPGRKVDRRFTYANLGRVMASAHAGAVINVTLSDTGETFTMTAPGGAFDARPTTPPPVTPESDISPSSDLRVLVPGERLSVPTRAVLFNTTGDAQIRTSGTPSEYQPTFEVRESFLLPIEVLEIGPETTAQVIGFF